MLFTPVMATRKPTSTATKAESKPDPLTPLTGKARRHLRSLGHSLDAIVHIGKTGISRAVLDELDQALTAHELVKVRLLRECPIEREKAAEQLASQSGAGHVQTLGNVLLFYRQRAQEPTIEVPGVSKPAASKPAAKARASSKAKAQIHHRARVSPGRRTRGSTGP